MKKIVLLVLSISSCFCFCSCRGETLKLFLPTEYISDEIIAGFKEETGVTLEVITFESNEAALMQIATGEFDIVVPSDYALEELVSKNLVNKIDWSQITGFQKEDLTISLKSVLEDLQNNVFSSTSDFGFDLLKYGVPYFWGSVGFLVNKLKYSDSELLSIKEKGWSALKETSENRRTLLYDSSRDAFMHAFFEIFKRSEYASINNPSSTLLDEAANILLSLAQNNEVRFVTDELHDYMSDENSPYSLSVCYSGDAIYLMQDANNSHLEFIIPNEGSNIFVDAMALPKNSSKSDLAYQFISYVLAHESQLVNSTDCGYASPRESAYSYIVTNALLPNSYQVLYNPLNQMYRYNSSLKDLIEEKWAAIRQS